MQICNACRYCEGFCAVFPAMTRRLEFGKADVQLPRQPLPQLRRLPACLPVRAAARIRGQRAAGDGEGARLRPTPNTRGRPSLGALYKRNGLTVSLALAAGLALFLVLALALQGRAARLRGRARRQLLRDLSAQPAGALMFGAVFGFAVLALGMGVTRFWRDVTRGHAPSERPAIAEATHACAAPEVSRRRPRRRLQRSETTASRSRAGASTTSRSTASCCASRRPSWRRSITTLLGAARAVSLLQPAGAARARWAASVC